MTAFSYQCTTNITLYSKSHSSFGKSESIAMNAAVELVNKAKSNIIWLVEETNHIRDFTTIWHSLEMNYIHDYKNGTIIQRVYIEFLYKFNNRDNMLCLDSPETEVTHIRLRNIYDNLKQTVASLNSVQLYNAPEGSFRKSLADVYFEARQIFDTDFVRNRKNS